MGGYLESTVKRGDSIYLYRSPTFYDQYGRNSDSFYSSVSGGLTSKGGFNLKNLHFLGLNDAIIKNEILDDIYSGNGSIVLRRLVRKAYYVKSSADSLQHQIMFLVVLHLRVIQPLAQVK